jgi:hypothetical protein
MSAARVSAIRAIVARALGSTLADLARPVHTPDRCVLAHVLWLDGNDPAEMAAALGIDAPKVGYLLREAKRHRERRALAVSAYMRHAPEVEP